jgi:hypothetical protein
VHPRDLVISSDCPRPNLSARDEVREVDLARYTMVPSPSSRREMQASYPLVSSRSVTAAWETESV